MCIPFGKFRGKEIQELPDDYLKWLRTIELFDPILTAVEKEFNRRNPPAAPDPNELLRQENQKLRATVEELKADNQVLGQTLRGSASGLRIDLSEEDAPLLQQLIDSGYRSMAKQFHPDLGGDDTMMREINRIVRVARASLRKSDSSWL